MIKLLMESLNQFTYCHPSYMVQQQQKKNMKNHVIVNKKQHKQSNIDIKLSSKSISGDNEKDHRKNGQITNAKKYEKVNYANQSNNKLHQKDTLAQSPKNIKLISQKQGQVNSQDKFAIQQRQQSNNLMYFDTCNSTTSIKSKQPKSSSLITTKQHESPPPFLKARKNSQNHETDFQAPSLSHSRSHEYLQKSNSHSNNLEQKQLQIFMPFQRDKKNCQTSSQIVQENNVGKNYANAVRSIDFFCSKINSKCSSESEYSIPSKSQQNYLTSPPHSIRQSMIPYQQYCQLYQKATYLQQQNDNLHSKLLQYENISLMTKKEQMAKNQEAKEKENYYQRQLHSSSKQISEYQKTVNCMEIELYDSKQSYEILKKQMIEHNNRYLEKQQQIYRLLQQLKFLEQTYTKNITMLNTEKQQVLKYYSSESMMLKQQHQQLVTILKSDLHEKQKIIERYLKENQQKNQIIQEMTHNYSEVMDSLENACEEKEELIQTILRKQSDQSENDSSEQNGIETLNCQFTQRDSNIHFVYSGQFQKTKQKHRKLLQQKNKKIIELEISKQLLNRQSKVLPKQQPLQTQQQKQYFKQKQPAFIKKLQRNRSSNPLAISEEVQIQLDYLRNELVKFRLDAEQKENIITKMRKQLNSKKYNYESKEIQLKSGRMEKKSQQNKLMENKKLNKSMNQRTHLYEIKVEPNKNTSQQQDYKQKAGRLLLNSQNINIKYFNKTHKSRKLLIRALPSLTILPFLPKKGNKQQQRFKKKIEEYMGEFEKMLDNCQQILDNNQQKIKEFQWKLGEHLESIHNKKSNNQTIINEFDNCQKNFKICNDKIVICNKGINNENINNQQMVEYQNYKQNNFFHLNNNMKIKEVKIFC